MPWKLPRKRKKAMIARYGRAAYNALRYIDRTRREGVLSLRHETGRRLDISVDFGMWKPVAVISEQVGDTMHVLAALRLSPGSVQVQERSRGIGRSAEQAGRELRARLVGRPSNLPGSFDLYMVTSPWFHVPKLVEEYKAKRLQEELGVQLPDFSPVMAKVLPLREELTRAEVLGDTLRALELIAEICGTIEREATREPEPYRRLEYILVDREPVALADPLAAQVWSQYAPDRMVAQDVLPDGVLVSTMFLQLDHSHGRGAPVLFETMVFGGPMADEQQRYCTWAEAEAGHKRWVAKHFEV